MTKKKLRRYNGEAIKADTQRQSSGPNEHSRA